MHDSLDVHERRTPPKMYNMVIAHGSATSTFKLIPNWKYKAWYKLNKNIRDIGELWFSKSVCMMLVNIEVLFDLFMHVRLHCTAKVQQISQPCIITNN